MKQFVILAVFILCACTSTKKENKQTEQKNMTKKGHKNVHWSYHGETGPKNWKNLCDEFSDCGGKSQSPINIVTKEVEKNDLLEAPKFNYKKSHFEIINNSHTVQFNISGENTVTLKGKEYKLLQFHYHALSEHTVDGKHYPLEVHFVHKHSDTDYAVLGVMYNEGKENKLFKKYLDNFPVKKGKFESEDKIDLAKLLPKDKTYYNYKGSLTTPPCSEVVNWYVLKQPIEASKEQIAKISKILNHNFRPTMPINNRKVELFTN